LKPNSPEVEEAGSGKVILPVEDDDAEAAIAAPDFMNAARTAVIVATGAAAAASVNKALDSASSACPASLIRTDKTIWLLDAESAQDVSCTVVNQLSSIWLLLRLFSCSVSHAYLRWRWP